MDTTQKKLLELLRSKLELFIEYDKITDQMLLVNESEQLESLVQGREELAEQIDAINSIIRELASEPDFKYSYVLSYTEYSKGSKYDGDMPLLETSEKIFNIMRDIGLKNSDISSKLENIKQKSLSKIKENFYTPSISSYFQNIRIVSDGNNFGRG